ncbi:autotransporter-associated beta strand protein [Comamonas sp. AG1104]|nr:autotransporter-associated beta strand protein [Comamonas sp. AG1104]
MNQVHRVVFNAVTGVWQAVSEIAKGRVKSSRSSVALGGVAGVVLAGALGSGSALAANEQELYWDPALIGIPPGSGGTGVWDDFTPIWTDGFGTTSWFGPAVAVFQGAAGAVSVMSPTDVVGLKFAANGYVLNGAPLQLINGLSSGFFDVSVGPSFTAIVNGSLQGNGLLRKLDTGTLVLNGANSYLGGTSLNAGSLVVGSNTALGFGGLTTMAGTTLDANTAVSLGNAVDLAGNLNIGGTAGLTLSGTVNGVGGVIKNGAADLTLSGNNGYLGNTALNAGKLVIGSNTALGLGQLNAAAGTTLDSSTSVSLGNAVNLAGGLSIGGSNNLTLGGMVSGSGGLTKNGTANLTLNGTNIFTGGTALNAGSLTVGNGAALGIGTLTVGGAGATLNSSANVTLNNAIALNSNLTAGGANPLTLGGVISGGSSLIKTGSSMLTLTGNNTYTGATSLNAGTLVVGSNTALGTGVLNAGNNTTLDASTATSLANNVNLGGNVTIGGSNALTLAGVVSSVGGLTKSGPADLILNGANTYFGNTALNVGKLIVGSNTALGSGALNAAAGTTLDTNTAVTLGNQVNLAGAMNIGGSADLTLTGTVAGAGSLVKNGAANLNLNGASTYLGGTTLNAGQLVVGNDNALGQGALTVAGASTLRSSGNITLANNVALNAGLTVGGSSDLTLNGVINGTAGLTKDGSGNLTLNGNNGYQGGTTLNAGRLTLGSSGALGIGTLAVTADAALANSASMALDNTIALSNNANLAVDAANALILSGGLGGSGNLVKTGVDDLTLIGTKTFTGNVDIQGGSLTTLGSGVLANVKTLNVGASGWLKLNGDASFGSLTGSGQVDVGVGSVLSLGGNNFNSTFAGGLNGLGDLTKVGAGTLHLTGNSGITGNTNVNAGTLNLTGSLASSQLNVNSGATLMGTGSALGAVTINSGGHLALSSGNTLSAASLTLTSSSNVDASLAAPSTSSLMNIGGNLTLDGNLNVTDAGGFGVGVYRLFNYIGALTDNGLTVASVPVGYAIGDLLVQTLGNQVNVVVSAPNTNLRFWDGSQTIANGTVDGGTGTWTAGGTNWTNSYGTVNQTWAGDFAVFQGTAGTVTVDGTQLFTGLQFTTNGYSLVNGTAGLLTAVNGSGGTTAMRVDPGVTATVGVNINGSGILNKLDAGTLVLNGANSYSGGTQLDGGRLVVGSNTALGTGALIANAGTQLDSNTAVTLANATTLNGNLTVLGSNALTLNGVISGTGGLIKNGSASLILGGNNAFLGPVALNAGGLILASNSALGSATLNAGNGTTLDASGAFSAGNAINLAGNLAIVGSNDLTLSGAINGAGNLTKNGAANLTLSGANNFLGGLTLNAGTLTAGSNGALGLGNLTVAGASSLDSNTSVSLGNNVVLNANLTNTGNSDVALSGVVSGTGGLIKNGASNLTLNGINTYSGGTTLNAGTVTLGTSAGLGSGAVTVAGASTLDTTAPLVLANNLNVNANLSVAGNNNLTLGGVIAGAGTLTKNGLADLTLTGNNTFSGTFDVQSGSLTTLGNSALGSNAGVNLGAAATLNLGGSGSLASLTGSGTALIGGGNTLSIGGNNASSIFDGVLTGTGELSKLGTGTLTLTGLNSLTGNTTVNAGTLNVSGSLDSASVLVNSGGTLTGGGSLGGAVTVADGGHLAGATGSTLSVNSLVFNANSNFDVGLGAPVSGGGNQLVNVGGNLTLDGTLNVSDIGGFGSGVYRLINYTGGLTDNGMLIGTVPGSVTPGDLTLQTALANQINLLVTAPGTLVQFWDGNQLVANGSVDGGSGTWGTGTTNWTDVNGTTNQGWSNGFAVFQGTAGTVAVNGPQTITGMQFVTDGYSVQNGAAGSLNLVNGSLGNATVRVDPNVTATVGVALNGAGTLGKYDAGTLVLNAANGYTGGTQLNGGKIVVGNNAALGTGVLTAANGTALDSNTAVSLANNVVLNGGLTVAGSNDLTLGGNISGTGSLTKNGSSTLTLNGSNTYTGGTYVQAGTLKIGGLSALVQGSFYQVNTGATLDLNGHALQTGGISGTGNVALGSQSLTVNTAAGAVSEFDGKMDGTGELIKQGDGTLSLNTANSFSGGVSHKGGNINLGNEKGLGSGTLAMDDGTKITLIANGMTIANNLHMTGDNDPIVDTGANNGTWTGAITGAGFLTKQGTGTLTLTSTGNTYTGATDVAQGTLQAGAANTFSSTSAHTVASGAVLDLAGYNQTLASLNNSGTVKLSSNTGAAPGTVLKVTGAYVGNNGNLGLSTVLGADGSATDKLLLSGASAVASGNTTVHITNAGGLGAQTGSNGIGIIGTENGASLQPGSFTLAGGHVDAGAYEYRLTQTAQGAALHSTTTAPTTPTTPTTAYRAEVPLLSALPAQLRQADMAMLGDLRKRMGDEGTQATTSSDTGASRRVWGRILRTDPKISQQGTVSPESSGHLTGFQAGLDLYADQSVKAGIYVGQLEGDMSVKGFASGVDRKYVGFNNLRTRYLGVYGTWQDQSGLYADAVLQGADYRSDLRTAGDTAQARTKGSGWLASLEMGKAFAVTSNWQIEPQAQIIYRKLSIDDTALSLATVKNKADDDWTVRLGARIKGNFATGAGVLQPYGRINVYKASNTTDIASFAAPGGTTDIKAKGGYTATEMAAGASLQINPRTSVYGELGKLWANGGDSRVKSGVQASIGVKVQW